MKPYLRPQRRLLSTTIYNCEEGTYVNWCELCHRRIEHYAWESYYNKKRFDVPDKDCLKKCWYLEEDKRFAKSNKAFWTSELVKEGIDPTKCTFTENGFILKKHVNGESSKN